MSSGIRNAARTLLIIASVSITWFYPHAASGQGCIGLCLNCEICNEWITIEGGVAGFAGSCNDYVQRRPEILQRVCDRVEAADMTCEAARQLCLAQASGGADDCDSPVESACKLLDDAIRSADAAWGAAVRDDKESVTSFKRQIVDRIDRIETALCDHKNRSARQDLRDARKLTRKVDPESSTIERTFQISNVKKELKDAYQALDCCPSNHTWAKDTFDFLANRAKSKITWSKHNSKKFLDSLDEVRDQAEFRCIPEDVDNARTKCQTTSTQDDCTYFCGELHNWLKGRMSIVPKDEFYAAHVDAVGRDCVDLFP